MIQHSSKVQYSVAIDSMHAAKLHAVYNIAIATSVNLRARCMLTTPFQSTARELRSNSVLVSCRIAIASYNVYIYHS